MGGYDLTFTLEGGRAPEDPDEDAKLGYGSSTMPTGPLAGTRASAKKMRAGAAAGKRSPTAGSSMATTKKLGLKAGQRLVVRDGPEGYPERLGALPEGASLATTSRGKRKGDVVLFFARDSEALTRVIPAVVEASAVSSVWIAYPKGTSGLTTDLNRDRLSDAVDRAGLRSVTLIALDETWSAMRFRGD